MHVHSPADLPDNPALYLPALSTWFQDSNTNINAGARLDYIKFNEINTLTGKYANQVAAFEHVLAPPLAGPGASVPGQLTLAVTLTTGLTRGRGHAGRFYPPSGHGSSVPSTDGRVSIGAAQSHGITAKALINSINAINAGKVVVLSVLDQKVVEVTGVAVGRVVDTQRRRRSSLPEDYQKIPLV